MSQNPKVAALVGFVRATLACAVLFGLHLSSEQLAALVLVAESSLVAWTVLRSKTTVVAPE